MSNRTEILLTFQAPDLDDEDLQIYVERLLPQIRDIEGVEKANLVGAETTVEGSRSIGGFALGAVKVVAENSNIIKGLWSLSNTLTGNNKTLKMTVKAPDGREFSGEAKSRDDFEYLMQQAEEFYQRRSQS